VIPEVEDPAEMDEEDKQSLREAAALETEAALAARDKVTAEVITSARWIQTSLLAVNGGAAAALLQAEQVDSTYQAYAGLAFVGGMLLALLQAYLGIKLAHDLPRVMTRAAGYWLGVKINLYRSEEIERQHSEWAGELDKRNRLPTAIGFASIFSFLVGCVLVAIGIAAG
jgi:hypothetical protein